MNLFIKTSIKSWLVLFPFFKSVGLHFAFCFSTVLVWSTETSRFLNFVWKNIKPCSRNLPRILGMKYDVDCRLGFPCLTLQMLFTPLLNQGFLFVLLLLPRNILTNHPARCPYNFGRVKNKQRFYIRNKTLVWFSIHKCFVSYHH